MITGQLQQRLPSGSVQQQQIVAEEVPSVLVMEFDASLGSEWLSVNLQL